MNIGKLTRVTLLQDVKYKGNTKNSGSQLYIPVTLASEWISKGIATGNLNEQIETLGDIADITGTIQTDFNSLQADLTKQTKKEKEQINAVAYGFKNDGLTDNSLIMSSFIANDSTKVLYFSPGVYIFNSEIVTSENLYFELDNKAELKLGAETSTFISFNKDKTTGYSIGCYIKGGIINGNFKCDTLIGLARFRLFRIDGCVLKNFNKKGIMTWYNGATTGGGLMMDNCLIQNTEPVLGSVGIYDNGYDNYFTNIEIQDVETCIYTKGSQFTNIHGWVYQTALLETSTFALLGNVAPQFNNIHVDTIRYGFVCENTDSVIYGAVINNVRFMWLQAAWGTQTFDPVLFVGTDANQFVANLIEVNAQHNVKFASQSTLTGSIIRNVKIHTWTGAVIISNTDVISTTQTDLQLTGGSVSFNADNAVNNGSYTTHPTWTNLPSADYGVLLNVKSFDWSMQIWIKQNDTKVWRRIKTSTTWESWQSADDTQASLKPTTASISKNADNAVNNGSYTTDPTWTNLPVADYGVLTVTSSLDWSLQLFKQKNTAYTYLRVGKTGVWDSWRAVGTASGNTASRPTYRPNGMTYFDTTLGKPIWWNGTNWVDANGTIVPE